MWQVCAYSPRGDLFSNNAAKKKLLENISVLRELQLCCVLRLQ